MRFKVSPRVLFAVCVLVALFAIPVLASAQPSSVATGTVTSAATGAKLSDIIVEAWTWDEQGEQWVQQTAVVSHEGGDYTVPLTESAYNLVRAVDPTGVLNPALGAKFLVADGTDYTIDLAMDRDADGPAVSAQFWDDSSSRMFMKLQPVDVLQSSWRFARPAFGQVLANDRGALIDPNGSQYNWSWSGSGVATIAVSVDGGAWSYSASTLEVPASQRVMNVKIPAEGVHSVRAFAIDKNGNQGKVDHDIVTLDFTPPSTGYVNDGKTITFKPVDSMTGVVATYVRVGTSGDFVFGSSVRLPATGTQVVEYYSVDEVGNVEVVKTLKMWAPATASKPTVSATSVAKSKSFKVSGKVYGRSLAKGSVYIYKLKGGAYVYAGKQAYTENSKGVYTVSLKLKSGTYKFKTHYGRNTATSANMPVFSAYSAAVKVK